MLSPLVAFPNCLRLFLYTDNGIPKPRNATLARDKSYKEGALNCSPFCQKFGTLSSHAIFIQKQEEKKTGTVSMWRSRMRSRSRGLLLLWNQLVKTGLWLSSCVKGCGVPFLYGLLLNDSLYLESLWSLLTIQSVHLN